MLISVTAPKKGMGQTQCAINLAGMLTRMINGRVLLGDMNQYSRDIEYYFSDEHALKGFDSLISLINSRLLSEENFDTCVKSINPDLDILIANECFELNESIVGTMLDYSEKIYEAIVFDTISGNNAVTKYFFQLSDVIVVVLNQYRNVCDLVLQNHLYSQYREKVVFVVNRYRDNLNLKKSDIKGILNTAGVENEVFAINYDVSMINECNDHSVLNYILSSGLKSGAAHSQITELAGFIIKKFGGDIPLKEYQTRQSGLFSFLRK